MKLKCICNRSNLFHCTNLYHEYVMTSAGDELILFVGACMMLCLGILMTIAVTAHQYCCRAVLTQSQGLFSSWCCPASEVPGVAQGAVRGHSQELTQTGQRDVPHHMASCSAITGRVKEEENIWSDSVCLPKQLLHMMSPAFWE